MSGDSRARLPGFTVSGGRDLGCGSGPLRVPDDPYRVEAEGPAEHLANGLQMIVGLRWSLPTPVSIRTLAESQMDDTLADIERRLRTALTQLRGAA